MNKIVNRVALYTVIMKLSTGIILSTSLPHAYKVALLDREHGRIDGIVHCNTVSVGALLRYRLARKNTLYALNEMRIDDMPFELAREDILFLHHVFELCYHLIPVGSCVDGMFDLLMYLYSSQHKVRSCLQKKLFLFKLLIMLGIYASEYTLATSYFSCFVPMPIDNIMDESLDRETEKKLDVWLHYCIAEHAGVNVLKTINFLIKSRVV